MSKNGQLLFRNYDPYITSPFGYRQHPITKVLTMHDGVDYGTNNKKIPTYAIEDGIVVKTGFASANGNYVYVNYPRLGKNAIYQHLDKISVQVNQKVTKDTIIGYVGETGNATGVHLHFGWFNSSDQNKGWYDRNWLDFEKYEYNPPVLYLGTPVKRNIEVSQIEVIITNLRVRKSPNGEILGLVNKGIYNILDSSIAADYTWYKIAQDNWIAYSKDFANLYLKDDTPIDSNKVDFDNKKEDDSEDIKEENLEVEEVENKDSELETIEKQEKRSLFIIILQILVKILKKILKFLNIL